MGERDTSLPFRRGIALLEGIARDRGYPQRIVCDGAREFRSRSFAAQTATSGHLGCARVWRTVLDMDNWPNGMLVFLDPRDRIRIRTRIHASPSLSRSGRLARG